MPRAFLASRARRALGRIARRLRRLDERVARLEPVGDPIGNLLFSYVIDPFFAASEDRISWSHTQDWEAWTMADVWRRLGFRVEVIHWTNRNYRPIRPFDLFVDVRLNLERLADQVGPGCLKVLHAETAHWKVNNEAQLRRIAELEARRGIHLTRRRLVEQNRAIELADCATVLGNEWTLASYRPFGKPLFRVPISNAFTYPSPADRKFDPLRGRFLWFGGVGFVHKGLDLVLEAVAGQDGLHLDVAAPLDREPDFAAAFRAELRSANVHTHGWVDVASPRFDRIAAANLGMVFPSCSEGGGGSAITAMHAGLIPVLTFETSVDLTPERGILLADARVETIRAALRELSARPADELRNLAMSAWTYAREHHTREAFRRNYRATALAILERFRPELRARVAA